MTPRSILIAGAGLAGSRCAETLRAEGYEGVLVLAGADPMPPYERPALSKELLAGTRDTVALRADEHWEDRGIELRLGTRIEERELPEWDAVVLATGARARRLAAPAGVHVLRTLEDALDLRTALVPKARLAIVGAGFVGAEVASTALGLGVEVTMVDGAFAPLERVLGRTVGSLLADRYRGRGVDLRLGVPVERISATALELADGTRIDADVVLVAAGAEPAWPGGAIGTDACGRTARPGVFACGDVTSWHRPSLGYALRVEHWTSAAGQAATVARTILGDPRPYDEPPYFWSDQFGLRLQHVGHAETWARVELEGDAESFCATYLDARGRPLAALAANRPQAVASFRRELAFAA